MFNYKLINKPIFNINSNTIDNILINIDKRVNKSQKGVLNIVFIEPFSIQKLNKNYRSINKVTDVLSFHYYDSFNLLKKTDIAGEIMLCEEMILSQAKEYGLGEEKEFYKLLIHSVLHILGYDHEKDIDYNIMILLEKKIWKDVFEK